MKKFVTAMVAALAVLVGGFAVPAQAAPRGDIIRCEVEAPSARRDGTIDYLFSTSHPRYRGRPFSLKVYSVDWAGKYTKPRVYDRSGGYWGLPRSWHGPKIGGRGVWKIEGWQSGQRCRDWVRRPKWHEW